MRIYVDIWTGQLKNAPDGAVLGPLNFFARDILPMELVFVDGSELVTSTVLAGGALLKLGIKARPGALQILALASVYTLVGEVASLVFSLNTVELVTYLSDSSSPSSASAPLAFEIEVSAADESTRRTYHQSTCTMRKDVITSGDTDPLPADVALYVTKAALFDGNGHAVSPFYVGYRGEITDLVGGTVGCLDAIATTVLTKPTAFFICLPAGGQLWVAVTDAVTAADGTWIVDPVDFNAITNPTKFKRFL